MEFSQFTSIYKTHTATLHTLAMWRTLLRPLGRCMVAGRESALELGSRRTLSALSSPLRPTASTAPSPALLTALRSRSTVAPAGSAQTVAPAGSAGSPGERSDAATEGEALSGRALILRHFVDPYELDPDQPPPGRRWRAAECRLKSNADLRKLWVVLMRERNMLASTKHYHRKNKSIMSMKYRHRYSAVRKSMRMIKIVLAEREKEAKAKKEPPKPSGEPPAGLTARGLRRWEFIRRGKPKKAAQGEDSDEV